MRISDGVAHNVNAMQYNAFRDAEAAQESGGAGLGRRIQSVLQKSDMQESDVQKTEFPGRNEKQSANRGDSVLDFDQNRIRRFVQRFAWPKDPPDTLIDIKDFKPRKELMFSPDGDKAELDFGRTQGNKKNSFGYGNIGKSNPIEPKGECQTCASRKYVDKSDDASVSYQTPTKLNPQTAALAVGAHEREHISNERANAEREGREIINQTVTIKYAVCPECNIMYPSGGVARTQSVESNSEEVENKLFFNE